VTNPACLGGMFFNRRFKRVVLPAPLGPMMPTLSPAG